MKERSGLKAKSTRQRRKEAQRRPVRAAYLEGRPWCEARTVGCSGRSLDVHEPHTRARGGAIDDPENMLAVCRVCHDWIHTHPAEATARGWLR